MSDAVPHVVRAADDEDVGTARVRGAEVENDLALGADGVVPKPFDTSTRAG